VSWLRAHAAFGQIAAGAATNPQNDKSGSAADQMGAVAGALGGAPHGSTASGPNRPKPAI